MKLFSGSAIAAGDTIKVTNTKGLENVVVQSNAATSCTALIQGRMGAEHDWVTLDTLTDSDWGTVPLFPQMRADVTAVTGQCEIDINVQAQV